MSEDFTKLLAADIATEYKALQEERELKGTPAPYIVGIGGPIDHLRTEAVERVVTHLTTEHFPQVEGSTPLVIVISLEGYHNAQAAKGLDLNSKNDEEIVNAYIETAMQYNEVFDDIFGPLVCGIDTSTPAINGEKTITYQKTMGKLAVGGEKVDPEIEKVTIRNGDIVIISGILIHRPEISSTLDYRAALPVENGTFAEYINQRYNDKTLPNIIQRVWQCYSSLYTTEENCLNWPLPQTPEPQ